MNSIDTQQFKKIQYRVHSHDLYQRTVTDGLRKDVKDMLSIVYSRTDKKDGSNRLTRYEIHLNLTDKVVDGLWIMYDSKGSGARTALDNKELEYFDKLGYEIGVHQYKFKQQNIEDWFTGETHDE